MDNNERIDNLETQVKSMQNMIIFLISQLDIFGQIRFKKMFPKESELLDKLFKN